MPLDPVLRSLLDQMPPPPQGDIDYPALRQMAEAIIPAFIGPGGLVQVASVEESVVAGPVQAVPLRIYRPLTEPRGTLHFIHGGGWTMGTLTSVDPAARRLCDALSMVVVSSTYRLAPEHQFPAGFEDSLAAARWVLDNLATLGGEARPAAISGDSAGGNLCAAITIALREAGDDHRFDAQLLLYPALDLRIEASRYASRVADADPTLLAGAIETLRTAYCGDADPSDWRISPLAAPDLANLPPALIVVQTVDPLHDEALLYADRLREAGVSVEVLSFEHLTHGFLHFSGLVPAAAEATRQVAQHFFRMLSPVSTAA
jgi:acetyl esterase